MTELIFSIIGLEGFAGAFGGMGPDAGEIAKERVEDCGDTFEDREASHQKRADHIDMILIGQAEKLRGLEPFDERCEESANSKTD